MSTNNLALLAEAIAELASTDSDDFREWVRLAGLDSAIDLVGIDLSRLALDGANLASMNLAYADFHESSLRYASFRGSDLTHADFSNADLTGADLREANLLDTNFDGATLSRHTLLVAAGIAGLLFDKAQFKSVLVSEDDQSDDNSPARPVESLPVRPPSLSTSYVGRIELVDETLNNARIVVVGVGGGGGNAVSTMIRSGVSGVDFISANTDSQALATSLAPVKVQIGCSLTKGLGSGANPEVGRKAALEQEDILREALNGADMVLVTAGMGGGTSTGAAPIIARISKELGALTVGVVTKPFGFEGRRRLRQAEEGIRELRAACDTLIVISSQRLLAIASSSNTAREAFKKADDVLLHAVRGISQIITEPGTINADFADIRTIMSQMGMAVMGHGAGYGDSRAIDAATNAMSSPLLEDTSFHDARGVLVSITACEDFGIQELNEAVDRIHIQAHVDANIIVGLVHDKNLEDEVRITLIATGFGNRLQDRFQESRDDAETLMTATIAPERAPHQVGEREDEGPVAGFTTGEDEKPALYKRQ